MDSTSTSGSTDWTAKFSLSHCHPHLLCVCLCERGRVLGIKAKPHHESVGPSSNQSVSLGIRQSVSSAIHRESVKPPRRQNNQLVHQSVDHSQSVNAAISQPVNSAISIPPWQPAWRSCWQSLNKWLHLCRRCESGGVSHALLEMHTIVVNSSVQ